MELLKASNLNFSREGRLILENLNFSIQSQEILGLAGPNGGGKSTLFELLMGWHEHKGELVGAGKAPEVTLLPQNVIKPRSIPLTVESFIEMGTWGVNRQSDPAMSLQDVLQALRLEAIRTKSIHEVSGGQWRLACIARVLVQSADLYLLDEPLNHLDLASEEYVGHLLKDLTAQKQKTFFVISHDWHAMEHFFDRVILLNRRILADGPVREVGQIYSNWRDPASHSWMHLS
jgi:ABC-type Mn2+/Zn2+ transport system ATPase subunit